VRRAARENTVRVLGPIEAWCDGRRLELGGPRQLALFAVLLVHANRAIARDVLRDALWGPARPGGDNRLQMAVARLRKSLAPLDGPAGLALRTVAGGYLLSLAPGQLDADVFAERLQYGLQAVQAGQPQHATPALAEALSLWRGPPLAEVAYEDFAQGEIRRLHELRRAALEAKIDADLALGRHRELIGELARLAAEHPTCEQIAARVHSPGLTPRPSKKAPPANCARSVAPKLDPDQLTFAPVPRSRTSDFAQEKRETPAATYPTSSRRARYCT
jgi:DNA-binding SARP family transcriptional activator